MKQPGGPAAKTPGVTMTRSITFPKTADGEWTNRETGVKVTRYGNGYRAFRPAGVTTGYIGICKGVATLAEARHEATRYVADAARFAIAKAYAEAVAEDAARSKSVGDPNMNVATRLCLRATGAHVAHMKAVTAECREDEGCTKADGWLTPHAYEYSPREVQSVKAGNDGYDEWERCGKLSDDPVHGPTNADTDWTDEQEERAAGVPSAQAADYSTEPWSFEFAESVPRNPAPLGKLKMTEPPEWPWKPEPEQSAEDTVHYWPAADGRSTDETYGDLSACGIDITTTPYTFGSPEWDEVTCGQCLTVQPLSPDERVGLTAAGHAAVDTWIATYVADEEVGGMTAAGKTTPVIPGVDLGDMVRLPGEDADRLVTEVYGSVRPWVNLTADSGPDVAAPAAGLRPALRPPVPADLTDDAAWATYVAALPVPTATELARVWAELTGGDAPTFS